VTPTRNVERPRFLGENWQRSEQGYSYASTPDVDLLDPASLASSNVWIVFLAVFERAKRGDFRELHRLPKLLPGHDDMYLYAAVLDLIGTAASGALLSSLAQYFDNVYFDVRLDAYAACARSYQLQFVPPLLATWSRHLSTEKGMIQDALSDLLEDGEGPISEGSLKVDFRALVQDALERARSGAPAGSPIFRGKVLSLDSIIDPIEELSRRRDVQEFSGSLMDLFRRFETFTGWPRVGLFDADGNALPLNIRWTLEEFRARGNPGQYQVGQRYFFGHPVA
jgi:hypothetical protein